jgi:rubrerythrin
MSFSLVEMIKGFYQDEMNDHHTYTALVGETTNREFHTNMTRIAGMEQGHADFWKAMLEAHHAPPPGTRQPRTTPPPTILAHVHQSGLAGESSRVG